MICYIQTNSVFCQFLRTSPVHELYSLLSQCGLLLALGLKVIISNCLERIQTCLSIWKTFINRFFFLIQAQGSHYYCQSHSNLCSLYLLFFMVLWNQWLTYLWPASNNFTWFFLIIKTALTQYWWPHIALCFWSNKPSFVLSKAWKISGKRHVFSRASLTDVLTETQTNQQCRSLLVNSYFLKKIQILNKNPYKVYGLIPPF